MSASVYAIPRFFGFKKGLADNLIERGFASEAINVDTSDGALQTVVGSVRFPDEFEDTSYLPLTAVDSAVLVWRRPNGESRFVTKGRVFDSVVGLAHEVRAFTAAEQALLQPFCYSSNTTVLPLRINGIPAVILACPNKRPVVIEDGTGAHNAAVREFGSGQFISSDEITGISTVSSTDPDNPGTTVVAAEIGRVLSESEQTWALKTGLYFMEHETDELDYDAVRVREVEVTASTTIFHFENGLTDVQIGHFVKIRGGLSDMRNHIFAEYYSRLFAAGDPDHPCRLYWSCLPGDGRTVEDWAMDDASVDTGGGHVEVGLGGEIRALFAMPSQLLIFKDREVYRLYGASPSQFTLERVFRTESEVIGSHRAIADANGVPYWVNADGLWAYNGSNPQRVDGDRSVQGFLREYSLDANHIPAWPMIGFSVPTICEFCNDRLFVSSSGRSVLQIDLATGSCIEIRLDPYGRVSDMRASDLGLLYSVYRATGVTHSTWRLLLLGYTNAAFLDYGAVTDWEHTRHLFGTATAWPEGWEGPATIPVDAAWESPDLTFGEPSYRKRLLRVGLEITGSVKITIIAPEGTRYERTFLDETNRHRRLEWLTVDMPYETSIRFRFESVDGRPFRIHNGVDIYVELTRRN